MLVVPSSNVPTHVLQICASDTGFAGKKGREQAMALSLSPPPLSTVLAMGRTLCYKRGHQERQQAAPALSLNLPRTLGQIGSSKGAENNKLGTMVAIGETTAVESVGKQRRESKQRCLVDV